MKLLEALEIAEAALKSYSMQGNDHADAAVKTLHRHRDRLLVQYARAKAERRRTLGLRRPHRKDAPHATD